MQFAWILRQIECSRLSASLPLSFSLPLPSSPPILSIKVASVFISELLPLKCRTGASFSECNGNNNGIFSNYTHFTQICTRRRSEFPLSLPIPLFAPVLGLPQISIFCFCVNTIFRSYFHIWFLSAFVDTTPQKM